MSEQDFPSWLRGVITKRTPDVLKVMMDLCQAGLERGRVSANDIHTEVTKGCAVGASFKIIKRLGFVNTGTVIARDKSKPGSHGSVVFVWELRERAMAEKFIAACRQHLLGVAGKTETPFLPGW